MSELQVWIRMKVDVAGVVAVLDRGREPRSLSVIPKAYIAA